MRLHIALDDERRWDDIEAALGVIGDTGHEWDDDPAGWVLLRHAVPPRRSAGRYAERLAARQ